MMETKVDTHDCHWRLEALRLHSISEERAEKVDALQAEVAQLKRMIFGKRSEKMPRIKPIGSTPSPDDIKQSRKSRKRERNLLPEVVHTHALKDDDKHCPSCGSTEFKQVGEGRKSVMYEWIPARLERQVHIQETWACSCGEHLVTAQGPQKPVEGGLYGAGFIAHIVTAKCCDSIPLYRMEKQLKRLDLPISRSTLCNLFHQAASIVKPIYQRMLELMPSYSLVLADETPIQVQAVKKTHKGYMWSFINDDFILYRYSDSRNGIEAKNVLKNSLGTLLVDGYAGYNQVCKDSGRTRAGCWAHARRKFFDALPNAQEAQIALYKIRDLYQVEYDAKSKSLDNEQHTKLRKQKSRSILEQLERWLIEQQTIHPPQSGMGKAITYTLKQWNELNHFIEDCSIPLDNNASERALNYYRLKAVG